MILTGRARFVPNRVIVNEERAAVVESGILPAHDIGEILAAVDENEGLAKSRIVRGTTGRLQRFERKSRGGQIGFGQRQKRLARSRLARDLMRVAPTAVLLIRRLPAQLLGQLPLPQETEPGVPRLTKLGQVRATQRTNRENSRIHRIAQAVRPLIDRSILANQPSQMCRS